MGILSGLGGLGLGNLEGMDIFESEEKEAKKKAAAEPVKVEEKDLIYDRTFTCPVCEKEFTAKVMKSGKAKLLGSDNDLRAKYEGIDAVKYDVEMCPCCGYSALSRYFVKLSPAQVKLIKEKVSSNVNISAYNGETYTYEHAMERYKLALVCAVVRHAKASEKAYICLKSAWLMRGYQENLMETGANNPALLESLAKQEEEYLMNAYKGFVEARQSEGFPMCGMDEITIDYLIAVLSVRFKKFDVASRMIASILASPSANARMKDKARDLKEEVLLQLKKK